jgi:hypothetical protein
MNIKIRKALVEDAYSFLKIKEHLSFKNVSGETTKGGFLLGTNIEEYQLYIKNDFCLVAENDSQIIGFGIVLKDKTLKKSTIWNKRHQTQWEIDIQSYENNKICYFEQLAFLNGYSRTVIRLCYQLMILAFEDHETLFTSTVHAPILNLAAVPYILKASGSKVAIIDEIYPEIGRIQSDIYKIERVDYEKNVIDSEWGKVFKNKFY